MSDENINIVEFKAPEECDDNPKKEDLDKLARALEKNAPHDEKFDLTKDGVHVVRASKPSPQQTYLLSLPSICIVPQGAKSVQFGNSGFEYDESKMVLYAAEIPIHVKVTKASKESPIFAWLFQLILNA